MNVWSNKISANDPKCEEAPVKSLATMHKTSLISCAKARDSSRSIQNEDSVFLTLRQPRFQSTNFFYLGMRTLPISAIRFSAN
jgi:hypothetical protein